MTNKPKKTTSETERRALCDLILSRATEMMVTDVGVSVEMVVDRLITYAAAQTVTTYGKQDAIDMFKFSAEQVEAGKFDHLIPDMKNVN